jgi:DnaK suppressor protein
MRPPEESDVSKVPVKTAAAKKSASKSAGKAPVDDGTDDAPAAVKHESSKKAVAVKDASKQDEQAGTEAVAVDAGAATAAKTTPAKSAKSAKSAAAAPASMPLPPPTSRFADRFAPPRPPTRQMANAGLDAPKVPQKADPKLANAWKGKAGKELTEPELLAMPESEYMNDKQLEFFRFKLQGLKDDLLSNAGQTTEHLREDTSIVPDPADRATIEEEHALELRTRDRERKLLKKISQSISRIDAGDYGFCDETGEPIGLGRLIARPTATLSLEAQQRRELKQKMFGD